MVFCVEMLGMVVMALLGIKALYNVVHFVYTTYLVATLGRNLDLSKYGPWAVVTGATDGIGKAYAQQLAAMGLNIMLISRTPSRLKQVADEIRHECGRPIQIRTVAADFTEGQSIYSKIRTELQHIRVGILVNNVGMKLPIGLLVDVSSGDEFEDIVNCNVMSVARMTNLVLPSMRKNKRGVIINIGSIAGVGYAPMRTTYGATKAFVDKFSQDLAAECRRDGIIVQSVLPGYVATKLPGLSGKSSFDVPTATAYVQTAIRSVGIETRTAAYWFHKIMLYWIELLYFCVPDLTVRLTTDFLKRKSMLTTSTTAKNN